MATMNAERLALTINKTAVDIIPTAEYIIQHITPFKYLKVIPIIFEGMDCVGKETCSNYILERVTNERPNDIVIRLSFPDYELDSGKRIRNILTEGIQDIKDAREFQSSMLLNRYEKLTEIQGKYDIEENNGKKLFLILDRFYLAHFAYNSILETDTPYIASLLLTDFNPLYRLVKAERDIYTKWFNYSVDETSVRGVTFLFTYSTDTDEGAKDREIHVAKLESKEGKDSFETIDRQEKVSKILNINGIARLLYKTNEERIRPTQSLGVTLEELKEYVNNINLEHIYVDSDV